MRKDPDRLFHRFRKMGDPRALARLFDEVAPKLLAVARHLVGNTADAEDVVQATFLVAIEKASRFDGQRPVLPWLIGVLSRQAGLVRRAQRKPDPDRMLERDSGDPANRIEQGELRSAVQRALGKIPAPYDEVLTIHLAEGEKPEEIARRLGRRPATVRVQLHRGLKLLRRALPAGLTAGLTMSAKAPRGLALVKGEVLEHLALHPVVPAGGAAAVGSGSAALIGGIAMSKVLVVGGAGLALAVGATLFQMEGRPRPEVARAAAEVAVAEEAEPAPVRESVDPEPPPAVAIELATPAPDRKLLPARDKAPVADVVEEDVERGPLAIDLNGRVIDAASEDPLAGASVYVYLEQEEGADEDEPRRPVQTKTGSDGGFDFHGLERPIVSLFVAAEGYVRTSVTEWNLPGLRKHDAGLFEVGTVELERGASVSGRIRADGPVGGAQIFQYQHFRDAHMLREDTSWAWEMTSVRDDGTYDLPMRVGYTDTGALEHGLLVLTESGLGWTAFELLEGADEHKLVDIDVLPPARLEVEVLGPDGRLAQGVQVTVDPRFDPWGYLGNPPERWSGNVEALAAMFTGTTDDDGRLELERLPLPIPGYGPAEHRAPRYVVEAVDPQNGTRGREIVELGGGRNLVRVELGQRELIVITGYVRNDLGEPLADAWVRLPDAGISATTHGSGAFELELDRPSEGKLVLEVGAEGYGMRRDHIEVRDEDHYYRTDHVLRRALPIAGIVVDQDGEPVARSHVSIWRREKDEERGRSYSMQTQEDGLFHFDHASAGSWRVNASPPFQERGWGGMRSVSADAGNLDVRVILEREPEGGATVVARVFDAISGTALDPEEVTMMESGGIASDNQEYIHDARRVAGGAIVEDVRPGAWRLWVRAADHVPGYVDFRVDEGDENVEVRIDLGGPASLRGTVLGYDERGFPGRAALMLAGSLNQPTYGAWATDATAHGTVDLAPDGSFSFEGLRPGVYVLRAFHGYDLASSTVELRPGEVTEANVTLQPGGWLHLVGKEPEEEGFVRLQVFAADGTPASPVQYAQRKDGQFRSGFHLLPGTYTWKARFRPAETPTSEPAFEATGTISIPAGEQLEGWVDLPR